MSEFLDGLDMLGAPLFVLAKPAKTAPGDKLIRGLYRAPSKWSAFTADDNAERLAKAKPGDAYGMVTGVTHDIIDVDPRNGGETSFKKLVDAGAIPYVYDVVSTPRGGFHLYIDPLGIGKHTGFLPGVDLQAAGGFVFIPPTMDYTWLEPYEWSDNGVKLGKEHADDAAEKLAGFALAKAKDEPVADAAPTNIVVPENVVKARVAQVIEQLDALAALDEGERLPWPGMPGGVGWDVGGLYAAERLVEASNSGASYSRKDAKRDFLAHSPAQSGTYDPGHKWSEAVKYVGTNPIPYEAPSDVFSAVMTDDHDDHASLSGGEIHSGQVRMAYRLATAWDGRLLFVYGVGWHYWDGKKWAVDNRGRAERAVVSTIRSAILESLGDRKLRTDIVRCDSASGIRGVLTVASTLEQFAYTAEQMDEDPYLVNCANGTLDLRDRTLRKHNPSDRCTKVARGAYLPEADQSAWSGFLSRVLPDEAERGYLQRVIGQAVFGGVREHLFPVLTGKGANGKGTAYGAVCKAFGDYATVINPDMLMSHDRGGIGGPEMMVLRGARLVVASELGRERVLDDSLMKRLTGGDQLTARHLFKEPVTWSPTHQLVYVSNHKPRTHGDDDAVWRRMRIIPFNVVIPEEERDLALGETLSLHCDAILTWSIQGFFDHEDHGGMREPESVIAATTLYKQESDDIARFIAERFDVSHKYRVTFSELWIAWLTWRDEEGGEILSKKAFGMSLDIRGFVAGIGTDNVKIRKGLRLRKNELEDIL